MLRQLPLSNPRPDARRSIDVLLGRARADRPPLVEYIVDETVLRSVVEGLLGRQWAAGGSDRAAQEAWLANFIAFWHRLGYDAVRYEAGLPFPENHLLAATPERESGRPRSWADEHRGLIMSWDDFERYPWPEVAAFDFSPFEYLDRHLPEGLGLLASHAGGVFEHLSWIMSYEGLCLALMDEPALVEAVAAKVGERIEAFTRHLLTLDNLCAVFGGDDLGFRSATLISPADLRRLVFPWHKRLAGLAHARGLPYFLHSCGNIATVMDDLITDVGIDGKHSFEDAILPAADFQSRYGDRIAVLGGVDVNILSAGTEAEVRRRTREVVDACGPRGRFAVGSGNSIPSYVPAANYLAMVDEALSTRL
jgi:uroporphyrinogen decarboxylase